MLPGGGWRGYQQLPEGPLGDEELQVAPEIEGVHQKFPVAKGASWDPVDIQHAESAPPTSTSWWKSISSFLYPIRGQCRCCLARVYLGLGMSGMGGLI